MDLGYRTTARLNELRSSGESIPALFQDVSDQLPLLLNVVGKLKNGIPSENLSEEVERSLLLAVNGCIRQTSEIKRSIDKWTPSPGESRIKRARKAFGSVLGEKKIIEALRILETYKSTLHMHSTISFRQLPPRPTNQLYHLPCQPIAHFIGREDILAQLSDYLESDVLHRRVAVLIGMGGQGKTQITLEYCRRSQACGLFASILWVDASSESALVRSYASIADRLSKTNPLFRDDESRVSFVQEFLGKPPGNWLIVFDNFDRPDVFGNLWNYFPSGDTGAFIITSRHTGSERLGRRAFPVPEMTEDDSIKLLLQRAKYDRTEESIAHAREIAWMLGCLPLALDQAGSYIWSRKLRLDSFKEHFARRKGVIMRYTPALWEYRKKQSLDESETSIGVFTTFEMSLDHVGDDKERPAIIHLLTLIAFLGSTNVRESWFEPYVASLERVPDWAACLTTKGFWNTYRFQDLAVSLHTQSLVQGFDFRDTQTFFSLHPLIKEWLRLRISQEETLKYVREAIELSTATVTLYGKTPCSPHRRAHVSLVDACMENYHEFPTLSFYSMEDSVTAFAAAYNAYGRYADAVVLYTSLLREQRAKGSPYASQTAMNMANTLRNQGKYSEAETTYKSIMEERTRSLGSSHAATLRALEGLAGIHLLQRKFKAADEEYQRLLVNSIPRCEEPTGATIRAIEGLANVRWHRAYVWDAEALYAKVLQMIFEDPDLQYCLGVGCKEGLAIVYRHQQRFRESVALYVQILHGIESAFGSSHPHYLRTELNLSIAYADQGKYEEARAMAASAHQKLCDVLGSDHADTRRAVTLQSELDRGRCVQSVSQAAPRYELQEVRRQKPAAAAIETPVASAYGRGKHLPNSERETAAPEANNAPGLVASLEDLCLEFDKDDGPHCSLIPKTAEGRGGPQVYDNIPVQKKRFKYREHYDSPRQAYAGMNVDFARVVELLQQENGIGPDMEDDNGQTQLSRAAEHGWEEMVTFLLRRSDVRPDSKSNSGDTPLSYASRSGHNSIVKLLLQRDDVYADSANKCGVTPLMCAAEAGHELIVRMLLERKDVEADSVDWYGRPPLFYAAFHNHLGTAKLLVRSGRVEVNKQDYGGETSLLRAVAHRNYDLARLLLESGANQVAPMGTGSNLIPLARAQSSEDVEMVALLLAHGSHDGAETIPVAGR
ncbi:MAG: hypothetical protein Q9202_005229 [Teloschistes flavicans]